MNKSNAYQIIKSKIQSLKTAFPCLRNSKDEVAFTALCVKSNYFKNPSLSFTETEINDFLVDSVKDGGVDALFPIQIRKLII